MDSGKGEHNDVKESIEIRNEGGGWLEGEKEEKMQGGNGRGRGEMSFVRKKRS